VVNESLSIASGSLRGKLPVIRFGLKEAGGLQILKKEPMKD